jgi:hypothetical protein
MESLDAKWASVFLGLISLFITILIQIGLRIQGAKRAAKAETEIATSVKRLEEDYKSLKADLESSNRSWGENFRQLIANVAELKGLVSGLRGKNNES